MQVMRDVNSIFEDKQIAIGLVSELSSTPLLTGDEAFDFILRMSDGESRSAVRRCITMNEINRTQTDVNLDQLDAESWLQVQKLLAYVLILIADLSF